MAQTWSGLRWCNSLFPLPPPSTSVQTKRKESGFLFVSNSIFFWKPVSETVFNERAARRSRSTSRFGCCMCVWSSPCSWATQEQLQSAITMASVNRIDSNFFVWLRVCLLYVGARTPWTPRGPRGPKKKNKAPPWGRSSTSAGLGSPRARVHLMRN